MYRCFACREEAVELFCRHEKAFLALLECSEQQQSVFLEQHDCEALEKLFLRYFEEAEIQNHQISLHLDNQIQVMLHCFPNVISTNQIFHNPLFDFLKRYHRNWCCIDESYQVHWFCSCNFE